MTGLPSHEELAESRLVTERSEGTIEHSTVVTGPAKAVR
jgi:hypothetical protein